MTMIKNSRSVGLIRSHKSSGFTFTEVLVVLAIVIAISAGAFVIGGNILEYSRYNAAKSQVSAIGMAVTEYRVRNGKFPNRLSDIHGTTSYPLTAHSKKEFQDPWGREIYYINRAGSAIIICLGADGNMDSDPGTFYMSDADIGLLLNGNF